MWLGPPDMNRKTTDFALALSGICGVFAASGFMLAVVAAHRACCSIAPKASAPKPQNASQRNSRRVCEYSVSLRLAWLFYKNHSAFRTPAGEPHVPSV